MGEKGKGSGGDGGGKWGERGRELGMWYPPVHPLFFMSDASSLVEPVLSKFQYFLLKDTMQWRWWG